MPAPLPDYPHLHFRRCWSLTDQTLLNLGRCTALIESLSGLPIDPELQRHLRQVSFQRGAHATTAIEGNTLSEEELRMVVEGRSLPPSREYQAREVQNAIEAMNWIWSEVNLNRNCKLTSSGLLEEFNRRIGQNLGMLYDGVPGRFRTDRRHVGRYLTPPPEAVPQLVDEFCDWLRQEFGSHTGRQPMQEAIVQAIVAHIFFEWIHPFADGNGWTGRLLEFSILLRAGLPDIATHVLANHYNQTRNEYTAHFDSARKERSLTAFLGYAVQGLVDGLSATLNVVQNELFRLTWESLIFKRFSGYTDYRKRTVFRRRRALALAMPLEGEFSEMELLTRPQLGDYLQEYLGKGARVLKSDLQKLAELDLVEAAAEGRYRARTDQLWAHRVPRIESAAAPNAGPR